MSSTTDYGSLKGSNQWRAYCTYSVSSTNTKTTITYTVGLKSEGLYYRSSTTSTASATGKSEVSNTVSAGDITVGGKKAVLSSKTFSWDRGTSSKTITFKYSTTHHHSSTYAGTSSGSFTFTVPALDSHTITYNANEGAGTSVTQTKYYGKNITLKPATTFTRTNYSFVKWNTKADGTGTSYNAGATYSTNPTSNVTLYAIWKLDNIYPTISNVSVDRCDSGGNLDDEGTYALVQFTASKGIQGGTTPVATTYSISGTGVSSSGTLSSDTENISVIVGGALDVNESLPITITLTSNDISLSTNTTYVVPSSEFPIDLLADNNGVSMGIMTPAVSGQKLTLNQNIYVGGSPLADFVTSQGTSGNWKYRKWNSGKVEAWYSGSATYGTATASGELYRLDLSLSIPSGIFVSTPKLVISYPSYNTVVSCTASATSATAIAGKIWRSTNTTFSSATVNVYAWAN